MSNAAVAPESLDLSATLDQLKEAFRADPYPDYRVRRAYLDGLLAAIRARKDAFAQAISEDFGHRSRVESMTYDVLMSANTLRHVRRNLKGWMAPEPVPLSMVFQPARAEIVSQPLGVVGVISPWNFPVQLAMLPLTYAIAAGNRVMLKPSELSPRTSALLAEVLGSVFPSDVVTVVQGDAAVGAAFASLPFDHLFFTGSTRVGRLVAKAAAENLTPVTLELGGKSPALVHPDYPARTAARALIAGKLANAGQVCVAPDYVLVRKDQAAALTTALQVTAAEMYPSFINNPDYTSIISERHRERLDELLADAEAKGGSVIRLHGSGESVDGGSGKFVPAIVRNPTSDMRIMQEELFGPILPIVEVESYEEMVDFVNRGERPLAMYLFDHKEARIRSVLHRTHAGGLSINDTLVHAGVENLPFGGVGGSGMGRYHGRAGFDTFSNRKGVVHQSRVNLRSLVMPPFGQAVRRLLDVLL